MKKIFYITKMVQIFKGYGTQVTTFENPVELIIYPKDKTFKVDNGFLRCFKDGTEITFITEDKLIIKYRDYLLTIVSEKILR